MQRFHTSAPVPQEWMSQLPEKLVNAACVPDVEAEAAIRAAFPSGSRQEAVMLSGLQYAFPEVGPQSIIILSQRTGLKFLEFFCGEAAVSRAVQGRGVSVKCFDLSFGNEDMWDCYWV